MSIFNKFLQAQTIIERFSPELIPIFLNLLVRKRTVPKYNAIPGIQYTLYPFMVHIIYSFLINQFHLFFSMFPKVLQLGRSMLPFQGGDFSNHKLVKHERYSVAGQFLCLTGLLYDLKQIPAFFFRGDFPLFCRSLL